MVLTRGQKLMFSLRNIRKFVQDLFSKLHLIWHFLCDNFLLFFPIKIISVVALSDCMSAVSELGLNIPPTHRLYADGTLVKSLIGKTGGGGGYCINIFFKHSFLTVE